ncbi:MAG: hypothetical protein AMQ74_01359 [Candidatus Methanofastidiosum methylothiophilum]|uniref:IgGFc-binding protein N-terminal domain-containing protein n=1 Tax=Candidatus Methanofastidiosum methylothiophilum TaxID=1705564 RepID=A0A150IXW0_9EURY|nr:MAG: hypothetical protein AMQ74_01359 [Candidatus Methanofastidiosum methylthiophilus]
MKKLILLLAILCLTSIINPIASFSQKMNEEDVKKNLPHMLGANNVGKEFWFSIPPCALDWSGGFPNFIKLYITAATKTLVTIEVPGKGYKTLKMTIPNDVIEVNIEPTVGQAYNHDPYKLAPPETVYPGAGIHIYADDPLVVYCIVRYQATSDGFLALPVSSLGREYIVATYPDMLLLCTPCLNWKQAMPKIHRLLLGTEQYNILLMGHQHKCECLLPDRLSLVVQVYMGRDYMLAQLLAQY